MGDGGDSEAAGLIGLSGRDDVVGGWVCAAFSGDRGAARDRSDLAGAGGGGGTGVAATGVDGPVRGEVQRERGAGAAAAEEKGARPAEWGEPVCFVPDFAGGL